MRKYYLKKAPFACTFVDSRLTGMCIALPDAYRNEGVQVFCQGQELMTIPAREWSKRAVAYRHQTDKYGRGSFRIAYFQTNVSSSAEVQFPKINQEHNCVFGKVTTKVGTFWRCKLCGDFNSEKRDRATKDLL